MAPPGGPYLMPDGGKMRGVEELEKPRGKARHTTKRGKDLLLAQIMQERMRLVSQGDMPPSAAEVHELNVLAAVGARRRRRWNNERVLRELAGPMTAEEMHSHFNPAPFGYRAPTAFEIVSRPQHAEIWDGFRNVDYDRQARVLEKWEQHNKEQAAASRRALHPQPTVSQTREQAAHALKQWGAVSRKARTALRKANVHTVLGLESKLLNHMDASAALLAKDPQQGSYLVPPLTLPGLDAWGRLLVHGLAEFHGLSSSTRPASDAQQQQQQQLEAGSNAPLCTHELRQEHRAQGVQGLASQQPQQSTAGVATWGGGGLTHGGSVGGVEEEEEVVITVYQRRPRQLKPVLESGYAQGSEETAPDAGAHDAITCCDVLMALAASHTGNLSAKELQQYVKSHIHGSETSSVVAEGGAWVLL